MVGEITSLLPAVNGEQLAFSKTTEKLDVSPSVKEAVEKSKISPQQIVSAVNEVQKFSDAVSSDTNLAFSIVEELSRTVVAVRAVGSDEIIRQFPPEEFLTVAKFIASQNPVDISGDALKGILFDEYS